jgi:S1-C subfamily serine protease
MKKAKMILGYMIIFVLGITTDYSRPPERSVPEKILDSIVMVNSSSGVVVYSNQGISLVLTAKHVVMNEKAVIISLITITKNNVINIESYPANTVEISSNHDIAIVEVPVELEKSKIGDSIPEIGDDLWIAANPNSNYRSLKKGIMSSHKRLVRERCSEYYWEVSGTIISGSSGGGVFDDNGNLVAIISGIDTLTTRQCFSVVTPKGLFKNCIKMPLTGIGYVVPLCVIKNFIIESSFGKKFK